jgi:hypothetical protein
MAEHADQANNLNNISHIINSKMSTPSPPIIIDSGATGHFFKVTSNLIALTPATTIIAVSLPDGAHIKSSHTGILPIPGLPSSE